MLLIWRLDQAGCLKLNTYKKNKTWIFILLVIYEFTVVTRYMFSLYDTKIYDTILIFAQILQTVIEYLVCYFYAVKSSKRLPNAEKIEKILKVCVILLIFLLFAATIE
jgi:hypothetical protein